MKGSVKLSAGKGSELSEGKSWFCVDGVFFCELTLSLELQVPLHLEVMRVCYCLFLFVLILVLLIVTNYSVHCTKKEVFH